MKELIKTKKGTFSVLMTAISVTLSVATMLYGVAHFGLREAWPELVLNLLYMACLVMVWMFFFRIGIKTLRFNYWCSICVGVAIVLRDILFPAPLAYYSLHLLCLSLSVGLLVMLTYFYARKKWQTYSKRNLWMLYIVDTIIATLYAIAIYLEPVNDYTAYLLTEIWIRPTIIYGLVLCFETDAERNMKETE